MERNKANIGVWHSPWQRSHCRKLYCCKFVWPIATTFRRSHLYTWLTEWYCFCYLRRIFSGFFGFKGKPKYHFSARSNIRLVRTYFIYIYNSNVQKKRVKLYIFIFCHVKSIHLWDLTLFCVKWFYMLHIPCFKSVEMSIILTQF